MPENSSQGVNFLLAFQCNHNWHKRWFWLYSFNFHISSLIFVRGLGLVVMVFIGAKVLLEFLHRKSWVIFRAL